mmetsp:Transcript_9454/g.10958  ORF Transcript_9454/g.10958 Transcript_9454/m.10958 type:complete len:428 (-) Transcript_9454:295-1578(-)|eukprot:CAMPEP_0197850138 /NCGR_PEP_ID=MMETSP1438-20131217/14350_1 /TAXON_ID=1461541 /ORGANISM="Pterosperma sp., Strain CCMP1384" /LENGTH=427 /DNA_ID=CAMNT_0043463127 /DNA_START=253 /DNA_END=1536 /DNA_ORIENTATION=+
MAAKSYVCNDCGAQLRSIKEAQDHGETTGHSNFSESEEAVLALVCQECGKPCRSQTEVDLHKQRTGHQTYVDKTSEAKVVDSEAQMQEIRKEQDEAEGSGDAMEVDGEEEMVPAVVDADLLKQLEDMGFPTNRATRGIVKSGATTVEAILSWIVEHEADEDIDDPVLVPKSKAVPPKKKLTPEEAKAEAAELIRKAKIKKDQEEREMEKLREKERIRSGKELQEAKRLEEEQERKRILEYRKREKAEEKAARARALEKLEEDKRARRIKMGLPPDPTPEELAEKAAKEKKKAEAEAEKAKARAESAPQVRAVTVASKMRDALLKLKQNHPGKDEEAKTCFATMLKYLGNIARAPTEEKFQKIKLGNAAFQTRVGAFPESFEFLELCGFAKDAAGEFLVMKAPVDMATLNASGTELDSAIKNPFFGVL